MEATTKQQAEQRYVPGATAPEQAGAFVDEFLERVGAEAFEARAGVLTTEMVADAVGHAPTQLTVRWSSTGPACGSRSATTPV